MPIAETLNLWNEIDDENLVLSLNLHPFQKSVNEQRLIERLRNIAVSSVNEVGLDLHLTMKNENHHCLF